MLPLSLHDKKVNGPGMGCKGRCKKIQRGTYLAPALAGLRRRYDLWSSVGRNIVMKLQNIAAQVYLAWIVCAVPATAGSIFVARLA